MHVVDEVSELNMRRARCSPPVVLVVRSGALSTALVSRSIAGCLLFSVTPATDDERERKMIFHATVAQPSAASSHSPPHRWLLEFPATRLVFHAPRALKSASVCGGEFALIPLHAQRRARLAFWDDSICSWLESDYGAMQNVWCDLLQFFGNIPIVHHFIFHAWFNIR